MKLILFFGVSVVLDTLISVRTITSNALYNKVYNNCIFNSLKSKDMRTNNAFNDINNYKSELLELIYINSQFYSIDNSNFYRINNIGAGDRRL
ncbi:hypothetical protein M3Y97_00476500 [Aphelenchoides bicaudatus]|nr:hypothetical protein M3Y97_00476500 [Aphelenchoides bicaudatus]